MSNTTAEEMKKSEDYIRSLEQQGSREEALVEARRLLAIYRSTRKKRSTKNELLLMMARLAFQGSGEETLAYCDEIIQSTEGRISKEDKSIHIKALIIKGSFAASRDNFAQGIATLEIAKDILLLPETTLDNRNELLAHIYDNLATMHVSWQFGTIEQGIVMHDLALELRRNLPDTTFLLQSLLNRVALEVYAGRRTVRDSLLDEINSCVNHQTAEHAESVLNSFRAVVDINEAFVAGLEGNGIEGLTFITRFLMPIVRNNSGSQGCVRAAAAMLYLANCYSTYDNYDVLEEIATELITYSRQQHKAKERLLILRYAFESALKRHNTVLARKTLAQMAEQIGTSAEADKNKLMRPMQMRLEFTENRISPETKRFLLDYTKRELPGYNAESELLFVILFCAKHQNDEKLYQKAVELLEYVDLSEIEDWFSYYQLLVLDDLHTISSVLSLFHLYIPYADRHKRLIYTFTLSEKQHRAFISIQSRNIALLSLIVSRIATISLREAHQELQKEKESKVHARTEINNFNVKRKLALDYLEQLKIEALEERLSPKQSLSAIKKLHDLLSESSRSAEPSIDDAVSITCPPELRTLLLQQCATLRPKELTYCHLVLQGWDSAHISAALSMGKEAFQKMKYRLARKLKVPTNRRFYDFLLDITIHKTSPAVDRGSE